jgi:DNA-binding CsgD family transcriptional regulator
MGLKRQGSRAPVLLAMAACAALIPRSAPVWARSKCVGARSKCVGPHDQCPLVISMARPDVHFPAPLSPSEAAVLRQLIGGATHAQIAAGRGTAPRTVANQLAMTFQKLRISGRGALTAHLILLAPEFSATRSAEAHKSTGGRGEPASNGSSQTGSRLAAGPAVDAFDPLAPAPPL